MQRSSFFKGYTKVRLSSYFGPPGPDFSRLIDTFQSHGVHRSMAFFFPSLISILSTRQYMHIYHQYHADINSQHSKLLHEISFAGTRERSWNLIVQSKKGSLLVTIRVWDIHFVLLPSLKLALPSLRPSHQMIKAWDAGQRSSTRDTVCCKGKSPRTKESKCLHFSVSPSFPSNNWHSL